MSLAGSAAEALTQVDAAVVATAWPQFRDLEWPLLLSTMKLPIIVDANWFLVGSLEKCDGAAYACVGLPWPAP
jgi:UDP-glucose 6-dehydrogenase